MPRDVLIRLAVFDGVVPVAIVALAMVAAWIIARRTGSTPPRWLAPAAFAIAWVSVDYATHGRPRPWPPDSSYRFLHLGLVSAAWGLVESLARLPPVARVPGRVVLAAAAAVALLETLVPHSMSRPACAAWATAFALYAVALAHVLGRADKQIPSAERCPAAGLHVAIVSLAAAVVLFESRSAALAQVAGGLAGIAGAAGCGGLLLRRTARPESQEWWLAAMLGSVVLGGRFLADARWTPTALLAAAPFAQILLRERGSRWRGGLQLELLRLSATAILAAAGAITAAALASGGDSY